METNKKDKLCFIPMLRLIDKIPQKVFDKDNSCKFYMERLINVLKIEGYEKDAEIVQQHLNIFLDKPVAMAVMDKNIK